MKKTKALITIIILSIVSFNLIAQTNTQKAINSINNFLKDCPSSLTINHDNFLAEPTSVIITYNDPQVKISYVSSFSMKPISGTFSFNIFESKFTQDYESLKISSTSGIKYSNSGNTKKIFDYYKIEINSTVVLSKLTELFNNLKQEASSHSTENASSGVSSKLEKTTQNSMQSNSTSIIFKFNKIQVASTNSNYRPIESTTKVQYISGEIMVSKKTITIGSGTYKEIFDITKSRKIENRYEVAAKKNNEYYSFSILNNDGINIVMFNDFEQKIIKVYNITNGFTLEIPFLK